HHNDFGLSTSIIMESATVANDKGSTTLHVGCPAWVGVELWWIKPRRDARSCVSFTIVCV
ncbi:MAG: hypothetical protein J6S93_04690, partial [Paludibacteraceae bacterium]|nr:hypothetical protein [Paludibacteraceae bacterium]